MLYQLSYAPDRDGPYGPSVGVVNGLPPATRGVLAGAMAVGASVALTWARRRYQDPPGGA